MSFEVITLQSALILLLAGGAGALIKDIIADGRLRLPQILSGELLLGSLGSIIIGAAAGYFVDHSPLTAFLAGYAGFASIEALLPKKKEQSDNFSAPVPALPTPDPSDPSFTIRLPFDGTFPLTQKFGDNPSWYKANGYAGHFGLDWATPWGTPILACDDGKVSRVGRTDGNGFYIELKHSWGTSLYCHFASIPILQIGAFVNRGDPVGKAGNTGAVRPAPTAATPKAGTHCHFSITISGVANPLFKNYIDPSPFFEIPL